MTQPNPMANVSALSRDDQIFLGAGFLTFIFSFIAFAHISIGGLSDTASAWHGIGVLAALLVLAATVVGALAMMSPGVLAQLPVGQRFVAVALAVLALVFFVIRWLTLPGGDVLGHHYGYSLYWGGYITLLLNIVMIAVGYKAMREAGETMPWQGGTSGGATPPPAA